MEKPPVCVFVPWGSSRLTFQKKLAFLSPSVRQAALSQCKTFTEAVQLNASVTQLTKAEYKETAGSARRLFQYHRLPDKSPALFLWIFGNVYLSKNCYMFIARFLAEPRLGNTTSWVLDTCGAVWNGQLLLSYPAPHRLGLVIGIVLNICNPHDQDVSRGRETPWSTGLAYPSRDCFWTHLTSASPSEWRTNF